MCVKRNSVLASVQLNSQMLGRELETHLLLLLMRGTEYIAPLSAKLNKYLKGYVWDWHSSLQHLKHLLLILAAIYIG